MATEYGYRVADMFNVWSVEDQNFGSGPFGLQAAREAAGDQHPVICREVSRARIVSIRA